MKQKALFFGMALLLGVSVGCNQRTVEEEVDGVCECIQSAETTKAYKKCREKMEEISDKYSYDPEAAEEVKKRLDECVSN